MSKLSKGKMDGRFRIWVEDRGFSSFQEISIEFPSIPIDTLKGWCYKNIQPGNLFWDLVHLKSELVDERRKLMSAQKEILELRGIKTKLEQLLKEFDKKT